VIATEVLGDAIYVQVQIFTQKDRVQTVTGRRSGDLARPLVGEPIRLSLNTDRLHWFDPETGKRIELTRLEKQRPLAAT
jgi:hypothetical protein